ncbi:MAG: DUF3786 domain-containing protein [Proteobacteria bacterium]|nr:DUF3786 domain-containing protein [Pseudomonadota bacterium]MBU1686192.1 DUF3786 domain-containing protein [Pseudomonadota bacterium]
MTQLKTPLEVYKLLPGTNCGNCYKPSCLAFAAAVVKGDCRLIDCPYVKDASGTTIASPETHALSEQLRLEKLAGLRRKISRIDLAAAAERTEGEWSRGTLKIKCLGKDFLIDPAGLVSSQCHTHSGLTIPLLQYILQCDGTPISGNWVPFRELPNGKASGALFTQRCEQSLHRMADRHPDLFEDLVHIFSGIASHDLFSADISVTLFPLPRVPILICYWQHEEDLGSKINFFYDHNAEHQLEINSLYALGAGLVMMFEKIVARHS